MKYSILLGLAVIALFFVARAGTLDPWHDAESHFIQSITEGKNEPYGFSQHIQKIIYSLGPPQIILIVLALIMLASLSYFRSDEIFIGLIVISPAFITLFTSLSSGAIAATIIAVGAALIKNKQYWAISFVPLCFALGPAAGILGSLIFIILSISMNASFVALGISFVALLSSVVFSIIDPAFTLSISALAETLKHNLLGIQGSANILLMAVGIIGVLLAYSDKKRKEVLTIPFIALLALSLEHGAIVFSAIYAYYATSAINFMRLRVWSFEELKGLTLLLIACGLIFITIIHEREIIEVDKDRVDLARFTAQGLPSGAKIEADASISGILKAQGFDASSLKEPPENEGFLGSALRDEGYSYILRRDTHYPYGQYETIFATSSPTTYRLYAVPTQ